LTTNITDSTLYWHDKKKKTELLKSFADMAVKYFLEDEFAEIGDDKYTYA
jgi:hypothetical protein